MGNNDTALLRQRSVLFFALLTLSTAPLALSASSSKPATERVQQQELEVRGVITEKASGKAVKGATVQIRELGLYSKTDEKGYFSFARMPAGQYTLVVSYLGMRSMEQSVSAGKQPIALAMEENSIALADVVVVAQENRKEGATSTIINRKAIEHMQATSLGEVLQLLPGAITINPDFTNVNKAGIRNVGNTDRSNRSSDYMSSLGTSLIINGAPISNNANLQSLGSAAIITGTSGSSGSSGAFSNSQGLGADMRQYSADNIESVEVIRGIAGVEYGDMTSGAILVQTKAGKEELQVKGRINPKLTQFWAGQGFDLGRNRGTLFVDMDYTRARDKEISAYASYNRLTGSAQYTKTFGQDKPLYTNTYFSFGSNLDNVKVDPDANAVPQRNKSQEYSYRFATNGKWKLNKALARQLNYTLSLNYALQKSYLENSGTSGISAVGNSYSDGTFEVPYLPASYTNKAWVEGQPINLFAKLSDEFYAKTGLFTHRLLVGADYRMDVNTGAGKTFDPNFPYRTTGMNGYRARAYQDVPALNQLGAYAEDRMTARFGERELAIQAGLRMDQLQPFRSDNKAALSPRINVSYDLLPAFSLRAGYGIASKAPTLNLLYPENAYFDVFSLNYYKQDPNEALALMSTRVYETGNKQLKLAKSYKKEIGIDWKIGKSRRLSITGYHDKIDNAYDYMTTLNSLHYALIPTYTVQQEVPGSKPVLSNDVTNTPYVFSYATPTNGRQIINKGAEFDFDMGRFDAIRTSFQLTGAYQSTRSTTTIPYILAQEVPNQTMTRIGVFAPRGTDAERLVTTLRAIHHIPELRFILTLTAQTIWIDKERNVDFSSLPIGYIPVGADQQMAITYFSEAERQQITAADRDIYLSLNEGTFRTESWKPLWLFNMKLTKEFARNMGFSFYANNFINNRPLVRSTRYPEQFTKRNIDIFFGTELSIKF
ncbi:TonB-dependent receptor [Sphingobacterium sp. HMA12]|uniref:TonB-dependent receptor n=1 Tax=Sphingobacterium sp. HMA12 TaxID=2050894 RepID=UPI000CE9F028|nr:TonB-dependent receptor [Sphingobacterium sp. HMA12]